MEAICFILAFILVIIAPIVLLIQYLMLIINCEEIESKRELFFKLIPFYFLYNIYLWYKNLK